MNLEKEYTKFIHYSTGSVDYPETKIELTIQNNSTLNEMLETVDRFLKAIGYCYDGQISIINEEE